MKSKKITFQQFYFAYDHLQVDDEAADGDLLIAGRASEFQVLPHSNAGNGRELF